MTSSSPSQLPLTTLPLNTMTPYVRAHLDVAGDTLHWDSWWTVLGFIPVRRDRLVLPLAEVADTRSRTWIHWDRLLVGLALIAAAPAWPGGWVAVPMLGAAGVLFVMAPTAQVCVTGTDGRRHRLSVCIRHKLDVDLVAAALKDLTGHHVRPRTPRRTRRTDPPTGDHLTT